MSGVLEQAQSCAEQGNSYPFCSPMSNDVWTNGSTHSFIWNYNYPFYVGYEKVNLYLYYIIKFEYVSVKNYTDIDRSLGGVQVTVDDSWFLSPLPDGAPPENLTMAGFYLPNGFSPYSEISSPISMFPRPFNFTVTQFAKPANGTNNSNSTNSNGNGNNSNGSNNNNNNNSNAGHYSSSLPGWAIAVIVLAVIAFICGVAALIWTMLLSRRNRRSNKLIPMIGGSGRAGSNHSSNHPDSRGGVGGGAMIGGSSSSHHDKKKYPHDNASINSQTKVNAYRSTDSVPMTTTSAAENASSIGTLTSRHAYASPLSPTGGYEMSSNNNNNKLSSNDAVFLSDTFRNTLGRTAVNDWNTTAAPPPPGMAEEIIPEEEDEEMKRRRLGEALLQRQLEEDGTSVKHAGRFTRVRSLADIPKSAVFEHPTKY